MSGHPLRKGGAPGFADPIPPNRGQGSINTNKDYYSSITSLRGRIIFVSLCAAPYIGFSIYLFVTGLEIQAIALLAVPLCLFLIFWFLIKKLDT